jgi:hypothetical protein
MSGAATDLPREFVIPKSDHAEAGDEDRSAASRPWLSVSGIVRGEQVKLRNALVGGVAAEQVEIERGVVRTAFASGEMKIHQGGTQLVLAGGDTSIVQGGAQAIVSNGSVELEKAGAGIILARSIDVGPQSTVVFGIARHLEVKDGGRVIIGPRAALLGAAALTALIAGIVTARLRMRRT